MAEKNNPPKKTVGKSAGGKTANSKKVKPSAKRKGGAKKSGKDTLITVAIVLLIIIAAAIWLYDNFYAPDEGGYIYGEGDTAVHFVDVGQGDGIIIQLPDGKNMIIDGGDRHTAIRNKITGYVTDLGITRFDYALLTHTDADHCGALSAVLNMSGLSVGTVFMPRVKSNAANDPLAANTKAITTAVYRDFVAAAMSKNADIEYTSAGTAIEGNGYRLTVYTPRDLSVYDNISDSSSASVKNSVSPIMVLEYNGRSVMFTGDATGNTQTEFLNYIQMINISVKVDVLKVAHHGSSTEGSNSAEFLNAVSPDYAVISCGAGNSYGHPHADTLSRLSAAGAEVFRTDEAGDIVCTLTEDSRILWYNSRDGAVTLAVIKIGDFAGIYLCLRKSAL